MPQYIVNQYYNIMLQVLAIVIVDMRECLARSIILLKTGAKK